MNNITICKTVQYMRCMCIVQCFNYYLHYGKRWKLWWRSFVRILNSVCSVDVVAVDCGTEHVVVVGGQVRDCTWHRFKEYLDNHRRKRVKSSENYTQKTCSGKAWLKASDPCCPVSCIICFDDLVPIPYTKAINTCTFRVRMWIIFNLRKNHFF
jgi:hypothetical protein